MGRKKGRRTKSDDGGSHRSGAPGFPEFAHGQYTFEGEIERFGALSRGMSGKDRMPKVASVALLVAILAPLVVLAVSLLVRLVNALF